jgi:hypothetical protein
MKYFGIKNWFLQNYEICMNGLFYNIFYEFSWKILIVSLIKFLWLFLCSIKDFDLVVFMCFFNP